MKKGVKWVQKNPSTPYYIAVSGYKSLDPELIKAYPDLGCLVQRRSLSKLCHIWGIKTVT
jgi:hypothetical protein